MRVFDCFPFFNELDVLEVRLNALTPYVDEFILTECKVTHSGNDKPLFFEQNKERYKNFNIRQLIVPPEEEYRYTITSGKLSGNAWRLEHRDREYLMTAIKDLDDEDIILLSDADEIPDLSKYKCGEEGAFKQKIYYYYFNCYAGVDNWKGTIAIKKKNIHSLNYVRNHRNHYPTIVKGGWHFSTMGTPEQIRYKIESVAHTELNTPEFKAGIEENRALLRDPYGGWRPGHPPNWQNRHVEMKKEMPDGPEWLLKNRERYPHLWI